MARIERLIRKTLRATNKKKFARLSVSREHMSLGLVRAKGGQAGLGESAKAIEELSKT
jgi:hypothetical protein